MPHARAPTPDDTQAMSKPGRKGAQASAMETQRQMLMQAAAQLQARQHDKASLTLQVILKRWPGQPDAVHFLGLLRYAQGDVEAGIRLVTQAIQGMPEQPAPWNNLGNLLIEARRFDEAESAYQHCLERDPGFTDALSNLSVIRRLRDRHEESVALCRRAIAARPDMGQAWYNLALSLIALGRIEEGMEAHSRAVLLRPGHLQARNEVARALAYLGRRQEAAELYRQWLAEEPDNAVVRHHLAACCGDPAPERASDAYVETVFDAFSATFDAALAALDYRAPALVVGLCGACLPAPCGQLDVADLGCGTGLCGPEIRPWARHLAGCDLSAGMLRRARAKAVYDTLVHQELVAYLGQHDAAFDLLVCADTLCYFGALDGVIKAACRALRPGGWFVFTVEAMAAPGGEAGGADFTLQANGRYAHAKEYPARLLAGAGFELRHLRGETLRMEGGRAVSGWLIAAQRASAEQD